MRRVFSVLFFLLIWIEAAWAIVGETTITATDHGQPIPEAKISLTFKTDTGKTIRRITTTNRHRITIPDRTRKVDIVVTTGRKEERRTDVDIALLTGGNYEIDIPGGAPPETVTPNDPSGPLIGGGLGGRSNLCNDFRTTGIVSLASADRVGPDAEECMSSGVRGSLYLGTSTRFYRDWLVGGELEVGYADTSKTVSGIPGTIGGVPGVTPIVAQGDSTSLKETWDFSARLRLGRYVLPSTVLYGTAGLALLSVKATVTCGVTGACGINGIPAFSATNTSTLVGWTAGAGVETALTDRWVARLEYRYADYGTTTQTFGVPSNLSITADIRMRTHTALVGIAYKFGN